MSACFVCEKPPEEIKKVAIRNFAAQYGLFGLMMALPTTPNFAGYDFVYLPKICFVKAETMHANEYAVMHSESGYDNRPQFTAF